MSQNETLIKLSGLRDDQLRRLMTSFIFEMTIQGRGTYEPGTKNLDDPSQLREINEVIHRVADALGKLDSGDRELAMKLLASQLEEPELTSSSFERAMRNVNEGVVNPVSSGA